MELIIANIDIHAEKRARKEKAAANGVVLRSMDLNDSNDMKELFGMLGVTGCVGPKFRLREFTRLLQQQDDNNNSNKRPTVFLAGGTLEVPSTRVELGETYSSFFRNIRAIFYTRGNSGLLFWKLPFI